MRERSGSAAQSTAAEREPHQAYVQAPPKSIQGRLDTWDSRYGNLVIAGDWVRTGFNLGSFESAVTGGKLAAFALVGAPTSTRRRLSILARNRGGADREALKRGARFPAFEVSGVYGDSPPMRRLSSIPRGANPLRHRFRRDLPPRDSVEPDPDTPTHELTRPDASSEAVTSKPVCTHTTTSASGAPSSSARTPPVRGGNT